MEWLLGKKIKSKMVKNEKNLFCPIKKSRRVCVGLSLCGFLHEDVIVLEAQLDQLLPLQGGVGAGHGNDLCLLHAQIPRSIQSRAEQFKRPELVQLGENVGNVSPAAHGALEMVLVGFTLKQRLGSV